jgi:hypothetical protein
MRLPASICSPATRVLAAVDSTVSDVVVPTVPDVVAAPTGPPPSRRVDAVKKAVNRTPDCRDTWESYGT